jgi:hypothetical protein
MPLFARYHDDHYPDGEPSPHADHHVVLTGGFECGGFHRLTIGPGEGTWRWGAHLTTAANFMKVGGAHTPAECAANIGRSFRAMLSRADLRERQDAKAGPPRRALADLIGALSPPDRRRGSMVRNEQRVAVRSGELIVGVLERAAHGAEKCEWVLTGLSRPNDSDFVWHGHADTEAKAFEAFEQCWLEWLAWAGLEQIRDLQRGVKR